METREINNAGIQPVARDFDFVFTNFFVDRYTKKDHYLIRFYIPKEKLDFFIKAMENVNASVDIINIEEQEFANYKILCFSDCFSSANDLKENMEKYHNIYSKIANNITYALTHTLGMNEILAIKRFSKTKKKMLEFDFLFRIENYIYFKFNNCIHILETKLNVVYNPKNFDQTEIFSNSKTPENIEKLKIIEKKFEKYLVGIKK